MRAPPQALFVFLVLLGAASAAEAQLVFSPPPKPVTNSDFSLWSRNAESGSSIRQRLQDDHRWSREMEWVFLTPKARSEILIKRHLSSFDTSILNRITLPGGLSLAGRAAQMERDAKWNQFLDESKERLDLVQLFDPEYARQMRDEINKTAYRRSVTERW